MHSANVGLRAMQQAVFDLWRAMWLERLQNVPLR
jgi:hypothetical protein